MSYQLENSKKPKKSAKLIFSLDSSCVPASLPTYPTGVINSVQTWMVTAVTFLLLKNNFHFILRQKCRPLFQLSLISVSIILKNFLGKLSIICFLDWAKLIRCFVQRIQPIIQNGRTGHVTTNRRRDTQCSQKQFICIELHLHAAKTKDMALSWRKT